MQELFDIKFHIENVDSFFSLFYLNYLKDKNEGINKNLLKDKYFNLFPAFFYFEDKDLEDLYILFSNKYKKIYDRFYEDNFEI